MALDILVSQYRFYKSVCGHSKIRKLNKPLSLRKFFIYFGFVIPWQIHLTSFKYAFNLESIKLKLNVKKKQNNKLIFK